MKRNLLLTTLLLSFYLVNAIPAINSNFTTIPNKAALNNKVPSPKAAAHLFLENKGQITDQYGNLRKDIDVKLEGKKVQVFIGDGQLHYQWSQSNSSIAQLYNGSIMRDGSEVTNVELYRMDVELVGANKNAELVLEEEQTYTEHYYLPQCPNGATAHSYKKLTYKNIYPNIDWTIYIEVKGEKSKAQNGDEPGFKYDFVVHPGGNPKDIQLRYAGATELKLKDGALEAVTPLGSTREDAPYCYTIQNEKEKIKKQNVVSAYRLEDNVLSFDIAAYEGTLIIDPAIAIDWATFYGGSGVEPDFNTALSGSSIYFYNSKLATDRYGNVYLASNTNSSNNIATSGSHQSSIAGNFDGMMVKFNSEGQRLWATYYGGNGYESINSIAYDSTSDNLYYGGTTTSSSGIATAGSHQSSTGGSVDGFLLKTDTGGSRIWATYYGGSDTDNINDITTDPAGNIYIAGDAESRTGIATSGSFQSSFLPNSPSDKIHNGFLAKFNSAGQRQWGTYYGETGQEAFAALSCDAAGNVYAGGEAGPGTSLTTTGAHQSSPGANNSEGDGILVKFSSSGSRIWATYYGGTLGDYINDVKCDGSGNVYITGLTISNNNIATAGAYQATNFAGNEAGFLVKFSSSGVRAWGTYLVSTSVFYSTSTLGVEPDEQNNIYIYGNSGSANYISTSDGLFQNKSGNFDAFLMQFSPAGALLYGTFYGGTGGEYFSDMVYNPAVGKIYLSGVTNSTSGIATSNGHQTSNGGGTRDAMVVSLAVDTMVYFKYPFNDTLFCAGDSVHIPYGVNRSFRSNNSFTLQLSDANGSFASPVAIGSINTAVADTIDGRIPPNTPGGTGYRMRIVASGPSRIAYYDTVHTKIKIMPLPGNFSATSNSPVCSGDSLKLQGSTDSTGVTWAWTGPHNYSSTAKDSTIVPADTSMTGMYILTATLGSCTARDTADVTVKLTPIKPNAGSSTPQLCEGMTLNLNASGSSQGATYSWTGPGSFTSALASTSRLNVIASWSGDYIATAMLNGCPARDTVNITIFSTPATPIAGSNSPVCEGGEIKLTATNVTGASYEWDGPNGFSATTQNPTRQQMQLNDAGVYNVLARVNGCASAKGSVNVAVNTGPKVLVYPNPGDTICPGWDVTFVAIPQNAGSSPTYAWYKNGSNTGGIGVTYKTSGITDGDSFYVQMTAGSACNTPISSKPLKMTVLPVHTPPTISITADPGAHVWPYVPVKFTAATGNAGAHPGYQWRRNGADIPNANDSIWVSSDLKTGDTICCVVTSNFLCAVPREVQSNCLVMNVDVGVNRIDNNEYINIYPNPSDGNFIIEMPSKGSIYISNLQGQQIGSYELRQGKNHISLPAGIAEGVYTGKVMTENGTSVVRMMVNP